MPAISTSQTSDTLRDLRASELDLMLAYLVKHGITIARGEL